MDVDVYWEWPQKKLAAVLAIMYKMHMVPEQEKDTLYLYRNCHSEILVNFWVSMSHTTQE